MQLIITDGAHAVLHVSLVRETEHKKDRDAASQRERWLNVYGFEVKKNLNEKYMHSSPVNLLSEMSETGITITEFQKGKNTISKQF